MAKKLQIINQISKPQDNVVKDIANIINTAQSNALRAVNTQLVIRNWLIGKRIDEEILTNWSNDYGKGLIKSLSMELKVYGYGFDESNLRHYHNFYLKFIDLFDNTIELTENLDAARPKSINSINNKKFLPWTLYRSLLKVENKEERNWYEKEAIDNIWSYRQLERNIKTDYYHRVLSNQTVNKHNQITKIDPNDYLKSIYVFEFLDFKKKQKLKESELEQALINNLKDFILELGKGYTFAGNQIHLRSNNQDYYVDLVFYNSILKCNVLIDLKVDKIQHKDIGQMLIYLDLYDKQYKQSNDNPSVGIILSSDSNDVVVKYLANNTNNNIVPSKYLTYLPTKEQLKKEINKQIKLLNKK